MLDLASLTSDASELVRALAALAWPLVVAVFLYLFRADIAALFKRIRHGRAAGVELDFEQELDQLQAATQAASASVPATSQSRASSSGAENSVVRGILEDATRSPRAALMALSAEIERRSREVLASKGVDSPWSGSFGQQIDKLDLSPPLREAAREFRHVRNRIVHGHSASDADALRAVDLGLDLLQAIERIPHSVLYVEATGLECFQDAEGKRPHNFHAVLLHMEDPDRRQGPEEVAYPISDPERLSPDEPVSWEWGSRSFPKAWYRHPSGDLRLGWDQALEFKGRPLHS